MKRVLKFSASWCQPCKMLSKNLEPVKSNVLIEEIDIDENQETAIDYGVRGVPTMIMLDGNNEIKRMSGTKSLKELEDWLND